MFGIQRYGIACMQESLTVFLDSGIEKNKFILVEKNFEIHA